jgi:hypothetical protein
MLRLSFMRESYTLAFHRPYTLARRLGGGGFISPLTLLGSPSVLASSVSQLVAGKHYIPSAVRYERASCWVARRARVSAAWRCSFG